MFRLLVGSLWLNALNPRSSCIQTDMTALLQGLSSIWAHMYGSSYARRATWRIWSSLLLVIYKGFSICFSHCFYYLKADSKHGTTMAARWKTPTIATTHPPSLPLNSTTLHVSTQCCHNCAKLTTNPNRLEDVKYKALPKQEQWGKAWKLEIQHQAYTLQFAISQPSTLPSLNTRCSPSLQHKLNPIIKHKKKKNPSP